MEEAGEGHSGSVVPDLSAHQHHLRLLGQSTVTPSVWGVGLGWAPNTLVRQAPNDAGRLVLGLRFKNCCPEP